jgi:hypothetical protein
MYYFKDLTNKRFGRLVVLNKTDKRDNRRGLIWNCKCDCGNTKNISSGTLTNGYVRSCGCLRRESEIARHKKRPYESIYNFLVATANKRNHIITITYEDYLEFTNIKICHYCNSNIVWVPYSRNRLGIKDGRGYNLDRKDNNIGYIKENCIVCCGRCNRGKNSVFTYEQWYKMTEPFRTGEL